MVSPFALTDGSLACATEQTKSAEVCQVRVNLPRIFPVKVQSLADNPHFELRYRICVFVFQSKPNEQYELRVGIRLARKANYFVKVVNAMVRTMYDFRIMTIVFLLVWAILVQALAGQEPGSAKTATFMRMKLQPSKELLEGLAMNDFDSIKKNAGTIKNLLLDENWMVVQSDEYRRQTLEFRKLVDQIRDSADKKNIDGATLAYVQMTIQCVRCHQTLRR